jgi:alpha-1,2-mannosyltransferase
MTTKSTSDSDHIAAGGSPGISGDVSPEPSLPRGGASDPSGRSWAARLPRRWLYVLAGVLLLAAIVYFFLVSRSYDLDLVVYRSAISWWWNGHDPYHHLYSIHHLAFTYPPFALLALGPLAAIPAELAKFLWFLVSLAAVTVSLFIVFKSLKWRGSLDLWLVAAALSCAALFVIEPVRSTFDYGQVNAVILVACLFDTLWPRFRLRGVLVGCAAAIKLTPIIFVLFFAIKRDVKAIVRASAAFVAATGLAWLVLPGPSHEFWTKFVWEPERTGKLSYPGNLSWDAVSVRIGLSSADTRYMWAGLAMVTLVVGVVAASRCVKAGSEVGGVLMVAITGLLVSPVSWSHHWIWMVMIIPLLLSPNELSRNVRVVLVGLLALVVLAPYWWFAPGWLASAAEAVTPIWAFVVLSVTAAGVQRSGATSTDGKVARPPQSVHEASPADAGAA